MASGISFPLKYSNFICEPYSSSYASCLNRFDLLDVVDENGKFVHYIYANYKKNHPEIKRTGGMVFDTFISNKNCKFLFQDIASM